MENLYLYIGIGLLVIVTIIGSYLIKHFKTNKIVDLSSVDLSPPLGSSFFTEDLGQLPIEPEVTYDNEYGECSHNPLMQCYIYANFGRFDVCKEIMREHATQLQVKPDIAIEMSAWLNHKLTGDLNERMLSGWNDKWIAIEVDPVKEAQILIEAKSYEEARELLEEALLHSRGESASVRTALREVSKLICSPQR